MLSNIFLLPLLSNGVNYTQNRIPIKTTKLLTKTKNKMKNLTKIFMAVAVALFAFSCVQDTTEDLGVNIKGQGIKELTLSLEESRTHLGEKVVNEDGTSLYPLYWSEGDAISVNGVVSLPLAGVAADATDATFQFTQEVSRPLCVVYPAAAVATVEEGEAVEPEAPVVAYPVNFLATQPYTVGTFAPQAAPMYGYAAALAEGEEDTPLQLQHLTGVLRLAIKGNGEKVTSIKVRAEKGAIAGAFTVDCTTGVLTPAEGASNTVTVTFAEPLVLGAEAAPVYLTVPAGDHGTYAITISTEAHQKMTVKFCSAAKPVNAGSVREFSAFEYAANTNDDEDVFIIDSEEALVAFAKIAPTFYPRTKAVVKANIDMSKIENWTPIASFGEFEFDGGSEEGYTFTNVTAPLFEVTAASIKNVKMTNVNIVETERAILGAIAATAYNGTWTNCEVSGTMEINNTTFASEISTTRSIYNIGGMVGVAGDVDFVDCTNRVNITVKSLSAQPAEGVSYSFHIAGVVGGAHTNTNFTNVDNYGNITFDGNVYGETFGVGIVANIIEYSGVKPHVGTITGCDNYGEIKTTAETNIAGTLYMCGLTRQIPSYISNLSDNHNHATIHHEGTSKTLYLSGLVGLNLWSAMENCSNNAPIYSNGASGSIHISGIIGGNHVSAIKNCNNNKGADLYLTENATANAVYIGGITAGGGNVDSQKASHAISNCNNYANISSAGTTGSNGTDDVLLAGITSEQLKTPVTGCRNEGAITFTGKVGDEKDDDSKIQIGGITSSKTVNGGFCVISECHNTGDLTCYGLAEKILIGGIVGEGSYTPVNNCTNSGKLEQKYKNTCTTNIGGIVADSAYSDITGCTNSGDIVISGESGNTYVGGMATYGLYRDAKVENCTNSGDIYVAEGGKTDRFWAAGIYGHEANGANAEDATKLATITGCTNTGSIYNAGTAGNTRLGGIIGTVTKGHIINCTNSGEIINKGTATSILLMGGIVGGAGAVQGSISDCKNTGAISNTGTISSGKSIYAGGLVSYKLFAPMTNCHNEGNINIGGTSTGRVYVAGLVANQQDESGGFTSADAVLYNCSNKGSITVGGTTAAPKTISSFHASGLINYSRGRIHNCENKAEGDILIQNATIGGTFVTGGLACDLYITGKDAPEDKWEKNYNRGDLTFKNSIGNTI